MKNIFPILDSARIFRGRLIKNLLNRQREYLFVGRMPEAVQLFVEEGSLTEVTAVQRSIADIYQDDFAKYAKQKDLVLLQQVFRYIPRGLGKKVKYSNMMREEPSIKVKNVIELLAKARICHQVFHSHCTGIPFNDTYLQKIYP